MACAAIRSGQASQPSRELGAPLFQPVAVREKGSEERLQAPMNRARVSHLFCSDDKKSAPPESTIAQPQAAAPSGLARRAAATASELIPINQKALPFNSSGARSHIQPPYNAAKDARISK